MPKNEGFSDAPTMIIPRGTDIQVDHHGQLSISTPGNLVIQNSGHYRDLESTAGSIRIEPDAEVEAVTVRCARTCYVEGSLTAWKVTADAIQLEEKARANIVLQETDNLQIGKEARIVGNFSTEKELFLLLSRFAKQLKSLPIFSDLAGARELGGEAGGQERLLASSGTEVPPGAADGELDDPLFFSLILLEREFHRSAYGPTSQRIIEELIKLLQTQDLASLRPSYRMLFGRIIEPGKDVRRAYELIHGYFSGNPGPEMPEEVQPDEES